MKKEKNFHYKIFVSYVHKKADNVIGLSIYGYTDIYVCVHVY